MPTTRFGRQPCYEALKKERWPIGAAAQEIGVAHQHLMRSVHGRQRPNEVIREKLPLLLGRPLTELFTAEALEPFGSGKNRPVTK